MMDSKCIESQEAIGWGRQLSEGVRAHVNQCERCSSLLAEICLLDERIVAQMEIVPPSDFIDRVMARIESEGEVKGFLDAFGDRLIAMTRFRAFEIGMASAGGVLTAVNLLRFVLAFVIPAAT